ncbi:hypothetical protein PC9H_004775 [Pleurotus ostreatus]|uniref:Uncharacterized protein n=1 Tax=Pleurotus ostreatus TaxID=5322 RepID=A0A8H7DTP6_PLEOS|nr:uncharacterized protein PC9H_004775 [Pleurotus ostreatus]KAF7432832.1 hypothetical protein PC9H_004775 [Pleurotus ostreatus]
MNTQRDRREVWYNWENVKGEYEGKISVALGKQYVIKFNALEVYPYTEETQGFSNSPSGNIFAGKVYACISRFHLAGSPCAQCLVDAVERFVEEYGEDGKLHFNEAVSNGEFMLNVNESINASVIGCEVKDGTYRVLFRYDCLGYNQSTIYETMLTSIDSTPREGSPVEIKASITTYWDGGAEDVHQAIGKILTMPDVVIDPNFEENYAAMGPYFRELEGEVRQRHS